MSEFNSAADAIRKLAKLYEPLVATAKLLDGLDSLENARLEREQAIAAAQGRLEVATKEATAAEGQLANVKAQADQMLGQAKATAANTSNNASVAARRLKEASERQAADILQAAEDDARRMRLAAASEAAAVREEIAQLVAQVETLKDEVAQLHGTRSALSGEIESMRQRVQGMLG